MQAKSRTEERELERAQASRNDLAERIARHFSEDGSVEAARGLSLFRYSSPTGPVYAVNEPSFCIIVQGSKELLLGNECFRYDASHYLLVSAGMPVVGYIREASRERPYLAVRLALDPSIVTAVLMETGFLASGADRAARAMAVSQLDANLLESVARIIRLVETPRDYTALAPLAIREIVYRLALGEQGGRLRQIAWSAGPARPQGLRQASPYRRPRPAARDEHFGPPPPLQGCHRDEPAAVSEAAEAARGPSATRRRRVRRCDRWLPGRLRRSLAVQPGVQAVLR